MARADCDATGSGGGTLDWWFARLTGLRHILVSGAARARGRNACRAAVTVGMSCMVAVFAFLPAGLRRAANDFTAFSFYAGNQANHVLACYKIAVVLYRSDDIRRCMDVTGAGFLSFRRRRRDGRAFRRVWIGRFARVLYTFVVPSLVGLLFWVSTPWLLDGATVTVRHADRTHSSYRLNVFNLYYGVPDAAYNRHFGLFYAVETVLIVAYAYFTFVFDIVMVIIGFAICGQLESVNRAIASLGYADAAAAGPRRRTHSACNVQHMGPDSGVLLTCFFGGEGVMKDITDAYRDVVKYRILLWTLDFDLIIFYFFILLSFSRANFI